jgi:hypothetical protein
MVPSSAAASAGESHPAALELRTASSGWFGTAETEVGDLMYWLRAAAANGSYEKGSLCFSVYQDSLPLTVARGCANRIDFARISLTVIFRSLCVQQQFWLVPAFHAEWIGVTRKVVQVFPIKDAPVRQWDVEAMRRMVQDFEGLADAVPEDFVRFLKIYGPAPVCRGHVKPIMHPNWSKAGCRGMLTDNPHIWYITKAREFRTAKRLAQGLLAGNLRTPWDRMVDERQLWPECRYIYGRPVLFPQRARAADFAFEVVRWWEDAWKVWWENVVSPIDSYPEQERSALRRFQMDVLVWTNLAYQLGPAVYGVRLCRACIGRIMPPQGRGRRPSYCPGCQEAGMRARLNSREYRKRRRSLGGIPPQGD